jgi:hypothetical protein
VGLIGNDLAYVGKVGSTYGGWRFFYFENLGRNITVSEASNLNDVDILTTPAFDRGYRDEGTVGGYINHLFTPPWIQDLTNPSKASATAAAHANQLLAEMFPPLTLPAGANALSKFSRPLS